MDNKNDCEAKRDCQRENVIKLFQALTEIDDRLIVESMIYLDLGKDHPIPAEG